MYKDGDILITYVEKFNEVGDYKIDPSFPVIEPGRVYRSIYRDDDQYQIVTDISTGDGVLLQEGLQSNDGSIEYELKIVDKTNIREFDFHEDDLENISEWIETDNADMKKIIETGMPGRDNDAILVNMEDPTAKHPDNLPTIITKSEDLNSQEREVFDKVMKALEERIPLRDRAIGAAFDMIAKKDKEVYDVLMNIVLYIGGTYMDKYSEPNEIDTKKFLYGKNGKAINVFQAAKYLGRYNTSGYNKNENPKDLMKVIHYMVFELVRKSGS